MPIICSQLLRSWWSFSYNVIIRYFPDPALLRTVQERKAMLKGLNISPGYVANLPDGISSSDLERRIQEAPLSRNVVVVLEYCREAQEP